MKQDRRFLLGWLVRRFPLILVPIAAIACSDSTAPVLTAAKYIITTSKTTAVVGDSLAVEAQLADANDHYVTTAGRTVSWFASSGDGHFATRSTQTDSRGIATNYLVVGIKPGAGTAILVTDDKQITGEAPAIPVVADQPSLYSVTASGLPATVNTTISLSAQLTDKYHNPIPIEGRVVSWSIDTTGGYYYQIGVRANRSDVRGQTTGLSAPTRGQRAATSGGTFASPTSTTNSQGVATVDFTVGTSISESYDILAKDGQGASGVSAAISVRAGAIAKFVVTVSVSDPPAGTAVVVSARPTDSYDNTVTTPGIPVTWSASGGGGTLSFPMAATDEDGSATNVLTTGITPGTTYSVTASTAVGSSQASGTSPAITTTEQVSLSTLATSFGYASSCGIANNGKVWCWGSVRGFSTSRPLPGKPIGDQTMSILSNSAAYSCGISAATVLCWGSNSMGELGDGSRTTRNTPGPISSSLSFSAITTGSSHSCALATTGDIYCWGYSDSGRLGDGTGFTGLGPIKVAASVTFTAVSAGDAHTCAIATSGDAYCWGRNDRGQLGTQAVFTASTPTLVSGGLKFTAIAAGFDHTCGIAGGTIYCWGDNALGEGGYGSTPGIAVTPTAVKSTATFVTVAAGGFNTCALASDSKAYCWGDNTTGELGDPNFKADRSALPIVIPGFTFKSIAVGGTGSLADYYYGPSAIGHACGITTDGVTYCWGSNNQGELGISSFPNPSPTPIRVSGQP